MTATSIKFQVSKPVLAGRERQYVFDAVDSGWISSNGPYLEKFERCFAERLGVEDCTAVTNGTVALHAACLALDLTAGQDVIVPALTYVATANAVAYCNANPVFADVDPVTWNVTAASIEAALTPETKGVIVVHLYGLPAPMEEILALCKSKNLWVIEDCAESFGASINGRFTGTFGDAATFSFYGNKTISTGEGGMIYMRDPQRRARMKMIRGQGMDPNRRYWHPIIGYNYRMTNVVAAVGYGQLECFDYHLGERRRIAATYRKHLAPLEADGILRLPTRIEGYDSSYWLTAIVIESGGAERRAAIQKILEDEHEIETRPFFVPLHQLPMYQNGKSYPISEMLGTHGLNLPTYSGLADEDIGFICEAFADALHRTS